eukprot:3234549-Rhodomonas_salina.1
MRTCAGHETGHEHVTPRSQAGHAEVGHRKVGRRPAWAVEAGVGGAAVHRLQCHHVRRLARGRSGAGREGRE